MERVRTAVVGCGVISEVYLQAFQEKFCVIELTACSDIDREKMEHTAKKYGIRPMQWQEILEDSSIELVVNLTNPSVHYTLTLQAIEAGKHVFSEKMLAVTFEEGLELCRQADLHQVRLGAAPDTFLGGGLQTAADAVRRGLAGEIISGIVSLTRDYRLLGEILPHLNRKGGSILYDMGCYYLTALCSILGPIERISAFGKKRNPVRHGNRVGGPLFEKEFTVEDCNVLTALLEFACGTLVTFHLNGACIAEETFHLELCGSKGILTLGDPNTFEGKTTLQKTGNPPAVLPYTHGYREQSRGLGAAEMAWAIRKGLPHRAGKEMALHVLEAAQGMTESLETGNTYNMKTVFTVPEPLPEGYIGNGFWGHTEESALL